MAAVQGASNRNKLIFAGGLVAALVIVVLVVVLSGGGGGEISTDLSTKPEIPTPDGAPPTQLEVNDVVEGDGPAAQAGDQITVQYVGVDYTTGAQFDASWDRGQPFPFQLGSGQVIPGWDQGLEGMKVGGRRELIIPPDLAYGPQGSPPDIGPNATLIFVIDLTDVSSAAAAGASPGGSGGGGQGGGAAGGQGGGGGQGG